jgi:hypothetical protein
MRAFTMSVQAAARMAWLVWHAGGVSIQLDAYYCAKEASMACYIKIHGSSMCGCDFDCSLISLSTRNRSDYIQQRLLIVDVYHHNLIPCSPNLPHQRLLRCVAKCWLNADVYSWKRNLVSVPCSHVVPATTPSLSSAAAKGNRDCECRTM